MVKEQVGDLTIRGSFVILTDKKRKDNQVFLITKENVNSNNILTDWEELQIKLNEHLEKNNIEQGIKEISSKLEKKYNTRILILCRFKVFHNKTMLLVAQRVIRFQDMVSEFREASLQSQRSIDKLLQGHQVLSDENVNVIGVDTDASKLYRL